MRLRKNPMTPLAAMAAGLLAGAVGTACLDAAHYVKYRRAGGTDRPWPGTSAPTPPTARAPGPRSGC